MPGKGADEWDYSLDLHQFNTSSMTTVSIPLSSFTRNMMASTLGPPLGFANLGDGSLTNFGLYEFGGLIPAGGGLLKLEMEYMELSLPQQGLIGDYNNNGIVDAADYTVWRDHLGGDGSLLGTNRDPANGSGVIGPADYASWKAHFGEHSPGSGSLAVWCGTGTCNHFVGCRDTGDGCLATTPAPTRSELRFENHKFILAAGMASILRFNQDRICERDH